MKLTRREWMWTSASAAGLAARAAASPGAMPLKAEFPVTGIETCLNNARWHPISAGAAKAVRDYLDYKATGGGKDPNFGTRLQNEAKRLFAEIIHAKPSEVAFVPSTTAGENLIGAGLGLGKSGGNIVTDALHFEGSLYQYGELARRGFDVRIIRPKNGRIELADLDRVITRDTRLVALSAVSMINGFQPDLAAVCQLAHSRGALVYADAVQAVGAIPVDVRASGVDFLACSSYKWLMGDMGLGFLYVREDRLDRIERVQFGFRQLDKAEYHAFPYDPPGDSVFEWHATPDAAGKFEVGTISNTTAAALTYSLGLIRRLGPAAIQAHRKPMLDRLQAELPKRGFEPMTPAGSNSPIVAFAVKDTKALAGRLKQANVDIAVYPHRIRISPSIYNDMADIEKLLACC